MIQEIAEQFQPQQKSSRINIIEDRSFWIARYGLPYRFRWLFGFYKGECYFEKRKPNRIIRPFFDFVVSSQKKMIKEIPSYLQPQQKASYPSYCTGMMIEQYIHANYKGEHERIYLPIYWTNYYVNNAYGNGDIRPLYYFLDGLDKSKKYFSVVQYDDGILEKPDDLDLLIFSSGSSQGIHIPLLPSHYLDYSECEGKQYDVSFIGSKTTHPIRQKMLDEIRPWVFNNFNPKDYYQRLFDSKFSLCPRGYGATSFRLYESLACRSVPIYISDEHILPYAEKIHWHKIAIIIHSSDIALTREIMAEHKQDWEYFDSIKHMFTMEGTLKYIESCLK